MISMLAKESNGKREPMTMKEFIYRCRTVTNVYEKAEHRWGIKEQWDKIDEEVQEFKDANNDLNQLEEGWDVIFATITQFHKMGYHDYAIMESMLSTLRKIETRSGKALKDVTI